MSLKSWLTHRKDLSAQKCAAEPARPEKKRHLGLKIGAKVFLAAHLALASQYPPTIYEFKLPDMTTGSAMQQFNLAARKIGDHPAEFPAYSALPASYRKVFDLSAPVAGLASGEAFYNSLPSRYKADALNLFAKSAATKLTDGTSVLDHLQSLREIDQDRIFANADSGLASAMDASVNDHVFNHRGKMDSSLHHGHGGFRKYGSYKTYDRKGNLDITLSHDNDNHWVAEIDIDYYKGLRHFFQEVVYNHAFDQRTDPYHVKNILRNDQGIDPGYKPK